MDLTQFVEERRPDWERLDRLVQRAGQGLGRLDKPDLRELGVLYRQASSDLARARSAATDLELVEYLNNLVVRAHGVIYRPEQSRLRTLAAFFAREFPGIVRQEWRPILLALAAAVLPALWCYLMASLDPQFLDVVEPAGMRERLDKGELWVYRINPVRPAASSAIMTNNIAVTFSIFALGIAFGAGTLWGLVNNGLHFGGIAVLVGQTRMAREFWGFVAPHGALEIPAIILGGGAGFILGAALLFPGDLGRKDALADRGQVAVKLVLGCVPILVMAGIIEAFFSPLPPEVVPPGAKLLVGAALFGLLLLYLLKAGTRRAPQARMTNDQIPPLPSLSPRWGRGTG